MRERHNPVSAAEIREIALGLQLLLHHVEHEARLRDEAEEALVQSIDWAIRLRSRQARSRNEEGIAPYMEQWLDDETRRCEWLLTHDYQILPEDAPYLPDRTSSWHCATILYNLAAETEGELSDTFVWDTVSAWLRRHRHKPSLWSDAFKSGASESDAGENGTSESETGSSGDTTSDARVSGASESDAGMSGDRVRAANVRDARLREANPRVSNVNATTVNACLKRRMFYVKRLLDKGMVSSLTSAKEYQQEYQLLLALQGSLNRLIVEGTFGDAYYLNALPF